MKSKRGSPEGYYAETGEEAPAQKPHTGEPNERYTLLVGAYAAGKMLAAVTHIFVDSLKIGTNDPRLLLGAPLLLAALAMLACYVPARKAMKINPLNALRQE